ncbi:MAG: YdbH domain-containing protein, partial [Desulfobacteraceae bacterium]
RPGTGNRPSQAEVFSRPAPPGEHLLEGLGGKTPLPVRVDYQCQASPGGKWRVSVKGAGEKKTGEEVFSFVTGEESFDVRAVRPRFQLKAAGSRFKGDVEFMAGLSNLDVDMGTLHARVSRPRLIGTGSFDFSRKGRGGRVNFTLATSRTTLSFDAGRLEIPKIDIPGRVALTKKLTPSVTIQPQFAAASAVLPEQKVTIETIEALVPLSFPFQEKTAKGRFSAGRLALNGRKMAEISGGIAQTGTGFDVSGTAAVTGLFKPDQESLMVDFSASAEVPGEKEKRGGATLQFETRKRRIVSNALERHLLASGRDMDFNFLFAAEGKIETDISTITSRITLDVSEGFFALPENSLAAGGIDTTLQISSINPFESGNSQVLTIDTIDLDDIHVSDVSLVYAVEPDSSLLLEGCDFRWCRGRVSTGAVRIVPGKEKYKLNLYCDRLKLSDILEQIGSFQAEGEGSLSGRIPLSYDRGIVSFDNGFLFSAPGRGGTIRVTGTDRLLSGIPRGTAQFSQIDLAREALKNYNYKWARLNFNTAGEELVVKMAFDGKPRDRLPFVYKKELQSFARVDASSPGSRFQGIAIDLNLRLPFNQVLQFGTRLNQILGSQ